MHDLGHEAQEAVRDWAERARQLSWAQPFHTAFDPSAPAGRWFIGGRLNVSVNCLDRHLPERREVTAIHWEGEPGDRRTITYGDLHAEVIACTRALRGLGVTTGDRIALYMGWLPETVVAMLACARIGAVHALLPAVLPADALADRLLDLEPKVVITQDGAWRRGAILPLKSRCDDALSAVASVEHTIVVRRTGVDVVEFEGDRWYHDLVAPFQDGADAAGPAGSDRGGAEAVEADHPLSIMYIASRRGRPTGIVHRSAGLLLLAMTAHRHGFAALPEDVLWCAVEFSWVVGQTHAVYGPLSWGATTVMYEGTLDTPNHGRVWDIIERYEVDTLLTTPSVMRNVRSWVDSPPGSRVGSLKRIATGGERIDTETAEWLRREVGHGAASIANVWGQTELGGAVRVRPWLEDGLGMPDPGLEILDEQGNTVPEGVHGELALTNPWPGLSLGHHIGQGKIEFDAFWGSPLLHRTGDEAYRSTQDHLIWIVDRIDPVIIVAAQLVSATEVAEVLEDHPFVRQAEVIDRPDRRRGRAVMACVVLEPGAAPNSTMAAELRTHVHDTLGGLATPCAFAFCEALPFGVERRVLRAALGILCARNNSPSFRLSAAQIMAAIAATPRK
ncbi:MAG: AMP-binding protein [Egibacteraceae bacterium]